MQLCKAGAWVAISQARDEQKIRTKAGVVAVGGSKRVREFDIDGGVSLVQQFSIRHLHTSTLFSEVLHSTPGRAQRVADSPAGCQFQAPDELKGSSPIAPTDMQSCLSTESMELRLATRQDSGRRS